MNETLFDKVKDYFNGKMTRAEQLLFEAEMETNKELATAVELYRLIEEGIDEAEGYPAEEALLRNALNQLHEQYLANELQRDADPIKTTDEKQPSLASELNKETAPVPSTEFYISGQEKGKRRRIKLWRNAAIAAAVTGIVSIGAIWFLGREKVSPGVAIKNKKSDRTKTIIVPDTSDVQGSEPTEYTATKGENKKPEQQQNKNILAQSFNPLYATHFKTDTAPSRIPYPLQEALAHYKNQAYKDVIAAIDIDAIKTAIENFRPRAEQDEKQDKEENLTLFYAHYYKAQSYLADNKAEKAIGELRNALTKSPDEFWKNKTQWYLALAYLKTGQTKQSQTWLKKVADSDSSGEYKQKALRLISEMSNRQ